MKIPRIKSAIIGLLAFGIVGTVSASERQLTGSQIQTLLPTIIATGKTSQQTFTPNGTTIYVDSGNSTNGKWWVAADQYCSSWPPATSRVCYDVLLDEKNEGGTRLIWVGDSGNRTTDHMIKKD